MVGIRMANVTISMLVNIVIISDKPGKNMFVDIMKRTPRIRNC